MKKSYYFSFLQQNSLNFTLFFEIFKIGFDAFKDNFEDKNNLNNLFRV